MQYCVSIACGCDAGTGVCALPTSNNSRIATVASETLLSLFIRLDVLRCHVTLDEFDCAGFRDSRMSSEEDAFRPCERRAAFVVLHVELRPLLHEPLDDRVGTRTVRCGVQCRQTH